MPNNLANALAQVQPGQSRLRGVQSGMNYQAAQVSEVPVRKSPLLDSLGKFAEAGYSAYQTYQKRQEDDGTKQAEEIIRKLTPEQIREATANGTLLYQDNPYAMKSLKLQAGLNGAYEADSVIADRAAAGDFETREDMEKARHELLQAKATEYAKNFGFHENDADYQAGFNGDITRRNVAIYQKHDEFLSTRAKTGAVKLQTDKYTNTFSTPEVLSRGDSGKVFASMIQQDQSTSALPNDGHTKAVITGTFGNIVNRKGGSQFLASVADQPLTVDGVKTTYKEYFGDERWNNMVATAATNEYELDAKAKEQFQIQIGQAVNAANPHQGLEQIQRLKEANAQKQPGEATTRERDMLIQSELALQTKIAQDTEAKVKLLNKAQQTENRQSAMADVYQQRINGNYVSVKFSDMPTNEQTGEFTSQDGVNFANSVRSRLNAMDIDQTTKDTEYLKYVRADYEGGPFRAQADVMVKDANSQFQAAIDRGEWPQDDSKIRDLQRLRNMDKQMFAEMYPKEAAFFRQLDMMDQQGLEPQVLIDANRRRASRSETERREDDIQWQAMTNNSSDPQLSRIPGDLSQQARLIYDSVVFTGGNQDAAATAVKDYLNEQTSTFSDGDSKTNYGMINKQTLRMGDDTKSWEIGKTLVENKVKSFRADPAYGWVDPKGITIREQNGKVYIESATGVRQEIDMNEERRKYQEEQRKAAAERLAANEKRKKEIIEQNLKSSPIQAARRTVAEDRRRKQQNAPKELYGDVSVGGMLDVLNPFSKKEDK